MKSYTLQNNLPDKLIALLRDTALFDDAWYKETYPDVGLSGLPARQHYEQFGALLGRGPNADIQHQLDTAPTDTLIANLETTTSKQGKAPVPAAFDDAFYLQTNPRIEHRKLAPYTHYLKYGHKDLCAPNADFDIVWYIQNYGHTYDVDAVDPFTHYLETGQAAGYLARPPRQVKFKQAASRRLPANARRACLFAAYDADGLIDDYVASRRAQPFPSPDGILDIDDVRANYLDRFEHDPIYDFHIGSYFMAFRSDVIQDVAFQRVINAIVPETRKLSIVLKYEVGITHFLIGHGYEFATWGQTLTEKHPVYTDIAFDLLADGFPLFKRYILAENPYKVSSVAYWKTAVSQANSITSIAQIEANCLRASNAQKLYRNHNITEEGSSPPPPMGAAQFASYDKTTAKYDNYWGFPVCYYDNNLSDNARAVFETVKDDPDIVKIVFTRGRTVNPGGVNVICVPLLSFEGQTYLARCRTLFVRHGAKRNLEWPVSTQHHKIINLWHGIPLKRIGTASLDLVEKRKPLQAENSRLHAVISASDVDLLAMNAAYAPLPYEKIWLTGLPRHDFITKPEAALPAFMRAQIDSIRTLTGGRKMILFCPTFRNDQENGYYNFSPQQVAALTKWLQKHNMVMGIREHLADETLQYSTQLTGDTFVRVQAGRFPDIEMLYREAAMLVTDYSSCFIDYMLTGRPMVSFAYDLDAYKERERGLFYELEDVFPGPIAQDFDTLMTALDTSVKKLNTKPDARYLSQRSFFIKYTDSGNAARVVEHAKQAASGSTLAKGFDGQSTYKTAQSIAFLYEGGRDHSTRHRIFTLAAQLRTRGWTCYTVDINNTPIHLLTKAAFVCVNGLELTTRTLDLIEGARDTGARIICDIDDLMHSDAYLIQSDDFMRDPNQANKLSQRSQRLAQIMTLAEGFTASTPAALETVAHHQRPMAVVQNSLSATLVAKYATLPDRKHTGQTHLVYVADAHARDADLDVCAPALTKLMAQRPDVTLHIVGACAPSNALQTVNPQQIHHHGRMPYAALQAFLRRIDIQIAPVAETPFSDAVSALKVNEAALHGVPSIASPTAAHKQVITHGKTGYLARTDKDWYKALTTAIDNPDKHHKMSQAAHAQITAAAHVDVAVQQFLDFTEKMAVQ